MSRFPTKLFFLLFFFLFLTGCRNCCPCNIPPPHRTHITFQDFAGCPWHSCCKTYREVEKHKYTCGKEGLIDELADQGVQVIELGDEVRIIIFADNAFETGTPNLDETFYPALNNIVKLLNCYGDDIYKPMLVIGYTDRVGCVCCKRSLSQHMADSVVAYLWSHDIPLGNMCPRGCSCTDPIATFHTTRGNAYNRRVEIRLRRADPPCHVDP